MISLDLPDSELSGLLGPTNAGIYIGNTAPADEAILIARLTLTVGYLASWPAYMGMDPVISLPANTGIISPAGIGIRQ